MYRCKRYSMLQTYVVCSSIYLAYVYFLFKTYFVTGKYRYTTDTPSLLLSTLRRRTSTSSRGQHRITDIFLTLKKHQYPAVDRYYLKRFLKKSTLYCRHDNPVNSKQCASSASKEWINGSMHAAAASLQNTDKCCNIY